MLNCCVFSKTGRKKLHGGIAIILAEALDFSEPSKAAVLPSYKHPTEVFQGIRSFCVHASRRRYKTPLDFCGLVKHQSGSEEGKCRTGGGYTVVVLESASKSRRRDDECPELKQACSFGGSGFFGVLPRQREEEVDESRQSNALRIMSSMSCVVLAWNLCSISSV
ncbi:hypothetical protein ACMD2_19829 [Ananas comosus]|uniref:Uncharacterized protein n=1 Tax=Ananas comosus TaxID=4615 RepID=A0A199VFW4_ANACO|nr:hypothetical protein ACMD2_19829 [Ananas comosus]